MQRFSLGSWLAVWAIALGFAFPTVSRGQGQPDDVTFETFDGVELHGRFYAASKGKAPCVILLHKLAGNERQQGWDELATALQGKFAVLSFDFRGHGESTHIENPQKFWSYPANGLIKKSGTDKEKISHKDFAPGYTPVLANDVAAAKRFLEKKNDAMECNASNVIVIGAEEGAAIGALWIASEFQRRPPMRNPLTNAWFQDPRGKIQGEDVAAAVWLSIPDKLNGYPLSYWLTAKDANGRAAVRDKVPMAFFYGDKDSKSAAAATYLLEALRKAGKEKLEFTRSRVKKTKLAGNELLGKKNLDTENDIVGYLENVMASRGNKAWVQRFAAGGQEPPAPRVPLDHFGFVQLR
jgi:hypothetical protein